MIKCNLCGFENPESTEKCLSCGALLQNRLGLVRDKDNPNCYSFTPGQRISKGKFFTVGGSGIDLVYKFSSSPLIVPLIIMKILVFFIIAYESFNLYVSVNSGFYTLIPLGLLYALGAVGWILMFRGGKKKNRIVMGYGLMLQYAYYIISLAYLFLTIAVLAFFVFAMSTANELYGFMLFASENAIAFTASLVFAAMMIGINLLINGNFYKCLSDMLSKNTVVFYRFTVLIIIFTLIGVLLFGASAYFAATEKPYEIASEILNIIKENINLDVLNESYVLIAFSGLLTGIEVLYLLMFICYILTYKKMFVPKKEKIKKIKEEVDE